MLKRLWHAYWLRHQHPASVVLHIIGVPACFLVAPAVALVQLSNDAWDLWWRPAAIITGGYALQFIGHAIEDNDAGEVCLLLRLLGRPSKPISLPAEPSPPSR